MKTWIIYLLTITFLAVIYRFLPEKVEPYSIIIYMVTLFSHWGFVIYLVFKMQEELNPFEKYEKLDV